MKKAAKRDAAKRDAAEVLDNTELVAAVTQAFCEGMPPSQIPKLIEQQFQIEISREAPYKLLLQAARRGWLKCLPPQEDHQTAQLRRACPWLKDIRAVHSQSHPHVAQETARVLVELVRELHRSGKEHVHIGFSGGNSMRNVAMLMADLLRQEERLPERLILHALVAGFDVDFPFNDPSAFFTYFEHPSIRDRMKYVGLHAPAIVGSQQRKDLMSLPGIREAVARVHQCDVLVTSAGSIEDADGMVKKYYLEGDASLRRTAQILLEANCVGDMMWLPISLAGPIPTSSLPFHSMSLLELAELPARLIPEGKKIVLAIAPCSGCGRMKDDILDAILRQRQPLLTHLVSDSRTIRLVNQRFESRQRS